MREEHAGGGDTLAAGGVEGCRTGTNRDTQEHTGTHKDTQGYTGTHSNTHRYTVTP